MLTKPSQNKPLPMKTDSFKCSFLHTCSVTEKAFRRWSECCFIWFVFPVRRYTSSGPAPRQSHCSSLSICQPPRRRVTEVLRVKSSADRRGNRNGALWETSNYFLLIPAIWHCG